MKKLIKLLLSIVIFIIFPYLSFASNKVVIITGDSVRFRSEPTIYSDYLVNFDSGTELVLLNDNAGVGNGCGSNWYQVKYFANIGYVCSEFARIEDRDDIITDDNQYEDYREYLKSIGFIDSYIEYLVTLHDKHPDWDFRVYKTSLDFNGFINTEYDGIYKGWSLIEDTGRYFDGYKSIDSWSYDYLTDTFNNSFIGGGRNWYAANKQVIGYYLDPRNFLNERQIFMFETLSYNSQYHTREGVEAMLSNTFMIGFADSEQEKTYVDAFMDAALKYNVSPYVLISRVIQEVGAYGSTIVSGTVSGYEGYYNFYNINATGETGSIITNGLEYAKEMGWDSPYKAILGGGGFLAKDYINNGQDTLYLQKWDLIQPNEGRHQYMQNIQAPSTESVKTYRAYNNMSLIDNAFVFMIPVYKNMPDSTILPSSANPNNYLKDLSVNGAYLFDSPTHEVNFDIVLDSNTTSVDIAASKVNQAAIITNTGSVGIPNDKEKIEIIVTAGNGSRRIYTINITKKQPDNPLYDMPLDISEILRVLNMDNDGEYIYGIKLDTLVSDVINSIKNKEDKALVSYFDKDNNEKVSGKVASGDKLIVKTTREEKEYTIVINGDVNGDGKIAATDYVMIKNHIMDVKKLSEFEKICADVNHDGKIAATDYVAIKNHIMDIKKIGE